ncbi:uncharacterized protein [Setaria viridis]|uniref:Uncharacterized protein n=1 Tax=Setaria viridis TaxID=4556 RepID=A0A4U6TLR5_SETVI|nr:uncharacterized protein LOC117866689 [Setaria viridis]TKW01933.1 hypothetical protein SEVIR_8G210801v2 [Setaria viridis]
MEELAPGRKKVETLAKDLKDPSSAATKSDVELPPSLKSFNQAFGTNLRKEVVAAHAFGSDKPGDRAAQKLPKATGEVGSVVLARKSRVDPDEASGKGKALVADEDVGKVFDSGEFLKLVRSLGDEDLAKLGAALGQKVAIAGAVAKERAESRSSQSKKLSELEARVSYLEKENDVLERLKNELREINSGLKENSGVLMKTCSELGEKNEELVKENDELVQENTKVKEILEDNAKVIDKLRSVVERDEKTIAEQV